MTITITQGWSSCDLCGGYDWYKVECPEIGYEEYYDGHLNGGLSKEEMLIEVLSQLGHTVEVIDRENNQ